MRIGVPVWVAGGEGRFRWVGSPNAVAYSTIARHLLHKAGLAGAGGATGAVTWVQRFGSALSLNVRFHI
jgi:hypothetical protein